MCAPHVFVRIEHREKTIEAAVIIRAFSKLSVALDQVRTAIVAASQHHHLVQLIAQIWSNYAWVEPVLVEQKIYIVSVEQLPVGCEELDVFVEYVDELIQTRHVNNNN